MSIPFSTLLHLQLCVCACAGIVFVLCVCVCAGSLLPLQLEQLPAHAGGAVCHPGAQQPPCGDGRGHRAAPLTSGTRLPSLFVLPPTTTPPPPPFHLPPPRYPFLSSFPLCSPHPPTPPPFQPRHPHPHATPFPLTPSLFPVTPFTTLTP